MMSLQKAQGIQRHLSAIAAHPWEMAAMLSSRLNCCDWKQCGPIPQLSTFCRGLSLFPLMTPRPGRWLGTLIELNEIIDVEALTQVEIHCYSRLLVNQHPRGLVEAG